MRDAAREMGTVPLRRVYRPATDLNCQSPLKKVKGLVLALVNMGRRASSRGNRNFGQEKRSAGLLSRENEPDLVSRAPIDRTCVCSYMMNLTPL